MLIRKKTNNLQLQQIINRTVKNLEQANVDINHIFREGNQVADYLAKLASTSGQAEFFYNFE